MPARILIVGAGAIGSFYGSRLACAPHALVSALCRSNYKAVKNKGFTITSPKFENYSFLPEHVFANPAEARNAAVKWDYLLVATKVLPEFSDDSSLLEGLVGPQTSIVLMQNGLGIEAPYARRFPKASILTATTIASVAQPKPGHIAHQIYTKISMGPYIHDHSGGRSEEAMQDCSRFIELLKAGGIADAEMYNHEDMQYVRWGKVAINCAMNPSSVLSGGRDTKAMASDPELSRHLLGVMEEVLHAAEKVLRRPPPAFIPKPEEVLRAQLRADRGSIPSMWVDWENGTRLELEVILGNPLRMAREVGVDTARVQTMYALLRKMQESRDRRSKGKL